MSIVRLVASRYGFSPDNRHRGSSITILVTISFCMVAMALVLSFMHLLANDRLDQIKVFESYDITVSVGNREEADAKVAEALSVKGVTSAFVYAECPILINGNMMTARFLEEGSAPLKRIYTTGKEGVRIPSSLFYLSASGTIRIMSLRSGKQARVVPKAENFPVSGVYASGDDAFDQNTVLFPLSDAQSFTSTYYVGIYASGNLDHIASALGGKSYKALNASLYGALKLEQTVMNILFSLFLLLVVSSIKRSSERLVLCKEKEIGMLRTMGLERGSIIKIFLRQSLLVSTLAVAIGNAVAAILVACSPSLFRLLARFSYLFRSGDTLSFPLGNMIGVSALVLAGTALFTYLGTRKVLSKSIMEMLHE